jgi:putative membrane protein
VSAGAAVGPGAGGPGAGAEPPWQWLSPRSLIVRPVTDLIRLLPVVIGVFFFGSARGSYWGLGFAALAIATSVVRYCTTRYRITGERIYLRHGLLSQKVLSVPRDRIRSVDLSAHVVYRILGLRKVSVGTGRNDRRDGGSLHLDALTRADAEALRATLLAGPAALGAAGAGAVGGGLEAGGLGAGPLGAGSLGTGSLGTGSLGAGGLVPEPAERELARLAPGWIRYAPLTLTGLVIVGVVVGTGFQVIDATHVDITAIGPVHRLTVSLSHISLLQRALEVALAILALLVLLSVAGYVALFWNFRLVSQGTGVLRVSRGLLSTRTTTIDTRRLRGAELSEPLLLRGAGGARCLAITTGLRVGHGAERGGSLLLPPAPRAVASAVAAAVLETAIRESAAARPRTRAPSTPVRDLAVGDLAVGDTAAGDTVIRDTVIRDTAAGDTVIRDTAVRDTATQAPARSVMIDLLTGELVHHGPAARRRRYARALGAAAVLAAAGVTGWATGAVPAWAGLGSLILLPLGAVLAADRYASLGHRLSDGWLVTRTGSLIRRRSVLSTEGIIGWRIHQSWFQRRQGLVSLAATTAAGRQHYVAHDIPAATALDLATSATTPLLGPFRTPA